MVNKTDFIAFNHSLGSGESETVFVCQSQSEPVGGQSWLLIKMNFLWLRLTFPRCLPSHGFRVMVELGVTEFTHNVF